MEAEARERYAIDTSMINRFILDITNAQVEDSGSWRCKVQVNGVTKQAKAELRVGGKLSSYFSFIHVVKHIKHSCISIIFV